MNVWRLIAHHEYPRQEADYYLREKMFAIGWSGTEDLRQHSFQNAKELTSLVAATHPFSVSSCVNGGRSLWHLHSGVQNGDLVIVSAHGQRVVTMRVTGDYYYNGDEEPAHYGHRRRAEAVPIDANRLWQVSGGMAAGENIRRTLIRCAHPISEVEFDALVG